MKVTLKAARVNANFSKSEIAEKLNVSTITIARWESNKNEIPVVKFRKLCEIYGCKEDERGPGVCQQMGERRDPPLPEVSQEAGQALRLHGGRAAAGGWGVKGGTNGEKIFEQGQIGCLLYAA